MDKLIKYIVAIPIILLALFPPCPFGLPLIANSFLWQWLVLISGFLGIFFIFTKADILLKILSVYLFFNCFVSKAPFISFTAYFSVIFCLYFYLFCSKLKDWSLIYRAILCILLLNILLLASQTLKVDSLLNFSQAKIINFGAIGNPMQLKSFIIVLLAFIISYRRLEYIKKHIIGISVAALLLGLVYIIAYNVVPNFFIARGPVWLSTIKLSFERPLFGWGIGTYKILFPPLSNYVCVWEGLWMNAHNAFLQMIFEIGYLGTSVVFLFVGKLCYQIIKKRDTHLVLSMILLGFTLLVHFPDRMANSVLIIIAILAFWNREVSRVGEI